MTEVYGGAEQATIDGNVSLTVTSGKFGRVFGGNKTGGSINGSIDVNVREEGCQALEIGELYGAGNIAPYSIYGCNDEDGDGVWTENEETEENKKVTRENAIHIYVESCKSIGKIFGGGLGTTARVTGNTLIEVTMGKGIIGEVEQDTIGKIGQIYGGGQLAPLKGNTKIDIGTLSTSYDSGVKIIEGNDYIDPESNTTLPITKAGIYGGGMNADVDGSTELNIGTENLVLGTTIAGNIFGGGYGKDTHVTGDVVVNIGANAGTEESPDYVGYATITGDVYGGSAMGKVNSSLVESVETATAGKTTHVNLYGGTISGDLYGGGLGDLSSLGEGHSDFAADVYGPDTVTVKGGKVTRVFGCNNVKGSPKSTAAVIIQGMKAPVEPATYTITSVYGGGNQAAYDGTGGVSVAMTNGWVNDVFGGGLGSTATVGGSTTVAISGGSVIHDVYGGGSEAQTNGGTAVTLGGSAAVGNDVYGGGSLADVQGAVTLTLNGGTVGRDVYGGGALAQTNTAYEAEGDHAAYVTNVTLAGATITGNLYGGGLGRLAVAAKDAVGEPGDPGYEPAVEAVSAVAANVGGPVTVTVSNGMVANVFGCNNQNGSPQRTAAVTISGTTEMENGSAISNVYGGGNVAAYNGTGGVSVTVSGGTANNVYGGGYGPGNTAIVNGNTSVTISGGTIGNDVYGGGSEADVTGSVNVVIAGGTVINDVYGGGALANTNTENWDAEHSTWKVENSTVTDYYYPVKHVKKDDTVVTGYYTRSGSEGSYSYTEVTVEDTKATENTTYYKKIQLAENIHDVAANGTTYRTSVSLTGGTVGNAYGGGLGRLANGNDPAAEGYLPAVAAMVYGDVAVTVDGTKFTKETARVDGKNIPTTGRVFGCNNINGTPKGSVKVWVKQTKRLDDGVHVKNQFEIQSVYGGGNKSHYIPETYDAQTEFGQRTQVLIEGCDKTSIEGVYGGGNASDVPFSDVTIEGSFQIGYVFGGGNGGDKINKGSGWEENPGANVTYYTNVILHGGTIGEAFGGSDSKGSVGGFELTKDAKGICPLFTENIYGASKEADSDGDVTLNLSGCESNVVDKVFGGSYNANVRGSITINITSGVYTSVYGGNDRKGTIGGNITINVEEVDQCNPIIIQDLYGGGSRADYPGTGALTYKGGGLPTGPKDNPDSYNSFDSGNITLNIKAATRIDRIYGGCDNAKVTGNTAVNINMVKGSMAGNGFTRPASYTGDPIPNMHTGDAYAVVSGLKAGESDVSSYYTRSGNTYTQAAGTAVDKTTYYEHLTGISVINDSIGTIGTVFGGGNQGDVDGNTTINICTEEEIDFVNTVTHLTKNANEKYDVLGAHIKGDVFGGGKEGSVTGNTMVNICAKDNGAGVYGAVAEGNNKVKIGGNVFGGGKGAADSFQCEKAMVGIDGDNDGSGSANKGTSVYIGHGTIGGDVYGGGEIGRVEFDTKVTIGFGAGASANAKSPVINGYVFGAGKGVATHGYSGLARGNSFVTIAGDAKVGHSVYGAGKLASLGRYKIATPDSLTKYPELVTQGIEIGMPYGLKSGGKSTVTIQGYAEIGPNDMAMPTFDGNVFGAGKGVLPYEDVGTEGAGRYYLKGDVYTWESYEGEAKETAYLKYIKTLGITQATDVTVAGNAFIKGSVYGGSENGRVRDTTLVKIQGDCQIGNGQGINERYTVHYGSWPTDATGIVTSWAECASWDYGQAATAEKKYQSYDRYQNPTADDGHTFYGNVFGGGSGYFPYKSGKWNPDAGVVGGSTKVLITGGHILTSIYGGNELTDVKGKCTITMSGGTIGVPRTLEDIAKHPVTCYLFGAGKGDQRTHFNTWTNVQETEVNVTGGIIYGSVFGGGEDGHVLGDTQVNISGTAKIGTWGTSYVDGNIFGGGRGFSGTALTAGTVGGNVRMDIADGTILGSVYGGGRMASVGVNFSGTQSASSGQFNEDGGGKTYGHITINISGGTIGNDDAAEVALVAANGHTIGGNVFGASMGRLTMLDGTTPNPLWVKMAQAKSSTINISGGTIKSNVYGGAEFGTTRDDATINMTGGTVNGHVYGGGYGSDIYDAAYNGTIEAAVDESTTITYLFTPMQYAGCQGGNTHVNISGGHVLKNVYGGGEMASVGVIDYEVDGSGNYKTAIKHDSADDEDIDKAKTFYNYGLSWPYEFKYIKDGKANVSITGTATIDGYVFGAGKGKVAFGATDDITEQRYTEAHIANVREAEVTIGTSGGSATTPTIGRSVYGGGEDGHVYEDAKVTIHHGTIINSVFGGGKGESTFTTTLWDKDNAGNPKASTESIRSWTAGKVYGNTSVTMNNGKVGWYIYGGGNMGSVGKANYAGGSDDYSTGGYGELPSADGALWTDTLFTKTGKTTVTIMNGQVGPDSGVETDADGIPHGSVFGGSRGKAAMDVGQLSPRFRYVPDFFVGYVNQAVINIGGYITGNVTTLATTGPTIKGSVYGGGQDGHVRNSTEVNIFKGSLTGMGDDAGRSGHVFGAGSGIGKYTDGGNSYCNNSSGSVTCTTNINIMGGSITGSVYGGGALASVGPPQTGQGFNEYNTTTNYTKGNRAHGSKSYNKITIDGGSIGGSVYGASRGPAASFLTSAFTGGVDDSSTAANVYNPTKYATSLWTEVNIKPNATPANSPTIGGSVYGGGEMGRVKESTVVNLTGGSIAHDAYGGGKGTRGTNAIAAHVGGNTTVELNNNNNGETADGTVKGCSLERIFGCNDLNGTPKGHVKVHVYATRHKSQTDIQTKYAKFKKLSDYTITNYSDNTNADDLTKLAHTVGLSDTKITALQTAISGGANDSIKKVRLADMIDSIANKKYDVLAVYGGGNLAPYEPTDAYSSSASVRDAARTEVIIDGCELTSIKQVYGGGNAASAPGTYLRVNGTYEIHESFGGGNGKDDYQIGTTYYKNPGANVGYSNYTHYVETGETGHSDATHGTGASATPYIAIENDNANTKEKRQAYYRYGSGVATSEIVGGRIHDVYGGSNEKGNVSTTALSTYQESGTCDLVYDNAYGAGKNAPIDGDARITLDCVKEGGNIYGGAKDAAMYSDVLLNITNGTFTNIYGGNNTSGNLYGSITINIQERGCQPINIGNLYGGGYLAKYSIYGYKGDNQPRTKEEYESAVSTALTGHESDTEEQKKQILLDAGLFGYPKANPAINIISATSIGNIYGGGYQAIVIGSPRVNVNMEEGTVLASYANKDDAALTAFSVGKHTDANSNDYYVESHPVDGDAKLRVGTIGNIYGGGNLADVVGNTFVEIGTGTYFNVDGEEIAFSPARKAANITGNVYGGGEGRAPVTGVYAFTCAEAMVGHNGGGVTDLEGNTSVTIGNGSVGGSVYGGGKIGRVENNTSVTIGIEGNTTDTITIGGNVFGAGQGVATHGYSGLARGNSSVTIQGKAKVRGSVYGGGEKATVGKYNVVDAIPVSPAGGGYCTVVVRDSAEIGPDNMIMTRAGGPDDAGHVFGAGKGVTPDIYTYTNDENKPWHINGDGDKVYSANDTVYLAFIETLGLASNANVTISGNAYVNGSVYGGAENGYVQQDTHVTIEGNCQIGCGKNTTERHPSSVWAEGYVPASESEDLECASWPYASPYATYDKFANATGELEQYSDGSTTYGGRRVASDGHTFYGNVFGGGSGYYPYKPGKWHDKAGSVGGNTVVDITGGHILTNVYGGNEMTDVTGTCTVNMSGGTIGVPRTTNQIIAHPVTCYLFGAGKGDQRVFFNKQTNIKDAIVNITGGTIYGSVFGGGEDGHVLRDVTMTIGNEGGTGPTIGTWGTTYVDGNVFGGGRGFTGDAYTAGNVAGSVSMTINGGTMLGSIYGGGRLGSVGYGLYDEGATGYGEMRDDDKKDDGTDGSAFFTKGRGHVDITINGGTIGNTHEYTYFTGESAGDLSTIRSTYHVPQTDFIFESDTKSFRLTHTRGGNVFAGGMGRLYQLDGTTPISAIHWEKLGTVKSTKLTINGGIVKSNVYGGSELGWVQGRHQLGETSDSVGTEILITGGTIGTEIKNGSGVTQYTFGSVFGGGRGDLTEKLTDANSRETNPKFIAGRVKHSTQVKMEGGSVKASIYGGGEVGNVGMGSSYGEDGSENAKVSTTVSISGGTVGIDSIMVSTANGDSAVYFGGATMGNVYGGCSGDRTIVRCGMVFGNTHVNISGGTIYHNIYGGGAFGTVGDFDYETRDTEVKVNGETVTTRKVYGVESLHTVGTGMATIDITGGTIGVDGHENGMVFGSSRGEVMENYPRDDYMAWAYDTKVNIGTAGEGIDAPQPQIKGSIYGSGENGHTFRNTMVNIHSGTIGHATEYYAYRGNVYGAGCGTDYYLHEGQKYYKPWAGIVRGNATVNIDGGFIAGNVYGAGAMASVGTVNNDTTAVANKHTDEATTFALSWPYKFEFADTTGVATINITGGHIGINGTDGGDVYGSARGEAGDRYVMAHHAYAKNTVVNISYPTTASLEDLDDTSKGCIVGSVHGSGENGYVYGDTHVTLNKGLVGHALYGGGKGYGTYEVTLNKIVGTGTYTSNIYSLIAGKVMGNTYVTMNDGFVGRNIYGGGNIASVGKGNYAGGADDYFPAGYGETLTGNLWDNVSDDSKAFWNSGKTTVNVIGGTVGIVNTALKEGLPYGNVFGSSRGEAAPNVPVSLRPRYQYCPGFFSGYVNETNVNIGGYRCKTQYTSDEVTYKEGDKLTAEQYGALASADKANWELTGPTIRGSVYGGGQDGHVRRDTKVTMYSGEIGLPYTTANQTLLQTSDLDNALWLHRGNIYGAGSGIDKYQFDFDNSGTIDGSSVIDGIEYKEEDYSTSAGSVTRFTQVDMLGGTIHRNVYGGGSMGSVGAPKITQDYEPYKPGQADIEGKPANGQGRQSLNIVTIGGAGNTVNIGTPTDYQNHYGGEVYGACRGLSSDNTSIATSVWTKVFVKNGANIQGNVFGGGDAGKVKKDTDVQIGAPEE